MTPPSCFPPCRACATARQGLHCHACGQSVKDEQPLALRDLAQTYAERITRVDRPLVHTARALFAGPGALARRYLDGERKQFLSPLTTYALGIALYLATYILYREAALDAALHAARALPPGPGASDPATAAMNAQIAALTSAWSMRLAESMKYVLLLGALPLAVAFRAVMPGRFTTGEWFAAMLYAFAVYTSVSAVVLPLVFLLPTHVASGAAGAVTNGLLFGVVLWTNRAMLDRQPGTVWRTLAGFALAAAMLALLMLPVAVGIGVWLAAHMPPPT